MTITLSCWTSVHLWLREINRKDAENGSADSTAEETFLVLHSMKLNTQQINILKKICGSRCLDFQNALFTGESKEMMTNIPDIENKQYLSGCVGIELWTR